MCVCATVYVCVLYVCVRGGVYVSVCATVYVYVCALYMWVRGSVYVGVCVRACVRVCVCNSVCVCAICV